MKKVALWVAAVSLLSLTMPALSQSPLPKEVQADMLVGRIDVAVAAGNAQEALDLLEQYRKLGVTIPPSLIFLEARLAAIGKDYARSKKNLGEYLARSDARTNEHYPSALALYSDIENQMIQNSRKACKEFQSKNQQNLLTATHGTIFQDCPNTPEMVVLAEGSFQFGHAIIGDKRKRTIDPGVAVSVRRFSISRYPITFQDWNKCASDQHCKVEGQHNFERLGTRAFETASFEEALSYVGWLVKYSGIKYRLVSEVEWEYARRCGSSDPVSVAPLNSIRSRDIGVDQWPKNQCNISYGDGEVGAGNVTEWTADCHNDYIRREVNGQEALPKSCLEYVIRGGYHAGYGRWKAEPRSPISHGFRIVRIIE